jgi:hypothetical protein
MSKHWPGFGSGQPNAGSGIAGSPSANGTYTDGGGDATTDVTAHAIADAAEAPTSGGVAEPATAGDLIGDGEATDDAADATTLIGESPAVETTDDPAATPAEAEATPAEAEATPAEAAMTAAEAVEGDDQGAFLAELVRTIRATAEVERARIAEDTQRRRQSHVDGIGARRASETDRMRELADEDIKAIDVWVESETKRIELERERRVAALNEDLEVSLAEHRSRIDAEIEAVESAVATYQAEIESFFTNLEGETDLVSIARRAAQRPAFPSLDAVSEAAAKGAANDPATAGGETAGGSVAPGNAAPAAAPVGVMAPQSESDPALAWPAPIAGAADEPVATSGDVESAQAATQSEPVAAAVGTGSDPLGRLLEPKPAQRPSGWPRRDASSGDPWNRSS